MPICPRRIRAKASSPKVFRFSPNVMTCPAVACSSPAINISSEDFPDPDGPTSASVSPSATSSDISLSISTCPAPDVRVRPALCSETMGEVMNIRLFIRNSLKYGGRRAGGKAITAFLLALGLAGGPLNAEDVAKTQTVRVMTFGDSLTAGYGLKREDGFVAQLGAWLDENGTPHAVKVQLLNG